MDDFIQINDINPYTPADVMPGTWSGSFQYAQSADSDTSSSDEEDDDQSPLCGYANTMGYGTVHACNPTPANCPLGRPLVPGRNIEDGLWSLPSAISRVTPDKGFNTMYVLALVALVVALTMSLRK